MKCNPLLLLLLFTSAIVFAGTIRLRPTLGEPNTRKQFTVYPIGWVQKSEGRTTIVVDEQLEPGLMGLERCPHVWVLYWFDRNDTPEQRSILQVHPRGDKDNPLRGVFATHSPVRPNLIAMSRCKIISVQGNVIEIEEIDALPDTPVLDLKSG
jgi:tRNA-Thr(GGU) m(6)t(6)A37 methyltransferase TsaA